MQTNELQKAVGDRKIEADTVHKYQGRENAINILTHTDFLIFNKLDKSPVLVVEVDGYAYHANSPRQQERDKMKDSILEKYNIPILRIKTNESGEERRLREKLMEVMKV